MPPILDFAFKALSWALIAAQRGTEVVELLSETKSAVERMVLEKRDPTAEEWEILNQRIEILRSNLHSDDA